MKDIGVGSDARQAVDAKDKRSIEAGYLQALKRRWWIAVVMLALSVGAAAFVTAGQTPVYRSSAMMVLAPSTLVKSNTDLLRSLETLERRTIVATVARIPGTPDTRLAVVERLGPDAEDVHQYRISGSVLPNTHIIRVDATGPDPVRAAEIANAAALVTRDQARRIYRIYSMRDLAQAVPRRGPVFPDPQRNYLVAAIIGLVLGLVGVFAVDWLAHEGGADAGR